MKKILSALKIIVPLALGIFLVWYIHQSLSELEKETLFTSLQNANYFWLILSIFLGLIAHWSRSYRWKFMFEPLGIEISLWNSFNAVMAGYFFNLLLPRAGEAARAGFISRNEGIPFEKSFGTILAERVIDLVVIAIICAITLSLQFDKLDEFREITLKAAGGDSSTGGHWFDYVIYAVIVFIILSLLVSIFYGKLRRIVYKVLSGLWDGLLSIFQMKKKWAFLGHTILIWILYLSMFAVCYQSIPETNALPLKAILAGFVAGTIGIIVVQGGIGIYPILVGASITLYLGMSSESSALNIHGYALGWLIWLTQTVLVIIFGSISLMLLSLKKKSVDLV